MLVLLHNEQGVDLVVYYCTDHTIKAGAVDKQFGTSVNWDTPLLEGYNYTFLKNISPNPALAGKTTGLINPGIVGALRKEKPDVLILHGWAYLTNLFALLAAKFLGIKILMRSESPLKQEQTRGIKRLYKRVILKRFCSRFLYLGEENRKFYKSFGIAEEKLFFTPYAVENERFEKDYNQHRSEKKTIQQKLNIPKKALVVLYSGKFMPKKHPLDLLRAVNPLKEQSIFLIMLGSGELETEMRTYIQEHQLSSISLLPGFVNQTQLYRYFIATDVFVLPSGRGETWGLVVNEAMNFHLPVIVSDMVGCTADLVREEKNGFTYPCGDVDELTNRIKYFLDNRTLCKEMGEVSAEIIKGYSNEKVVEGILKAVK